MSGVQQVKDNRMWKEGWDGRQALLLGLLIFALFRNSGWWGAQRRKEPSVQANSRWDFRQPPGIYPSNFRMISHLQQ
jgi:hypothetical protein